jgi:hypothetical protein
MIYTHVSSKKISEIKSPFDDLMVLKMREGKNNRYFLLAEKFVLATSTGGIVALPGEKSATIT